MVEWVEESAAKFSAEGQRFQGAYDAKQAVRRDVEPKLKQAWHELQRQQGNMGNRPAYYPPNVIVPRANFRYGMDRLDDQTLRTCFPKFAKLMTDADTRAAAERQAEAERQAAEAERQRQEEAAREAARSAAAAEAAKRQAEAEAEEATPHGQVRRAYSLYILLRWCHGARQGYLVKYVNDVEMERVETAIKAIVSRWKPREPNMDTDLLWQQADQMSAGQPISSSLCNSWFHRLMAMSPVPAIRVEKPN